MTTVFIVAGFIAAIFGIAWLSVFLDRPALPKFDPRKDMIQRVRIGVIKGELTQEQADKFLQQVG